MPKPLKRKGALYKFVGTAIIFVSFITQNFLYESWRAASDALFSAQQSRSLIDKGALINEASYFILSAGDRSAALPDQGAVAEHKIRQYALKVYQSEVINISALKSIEPKDKETYIGALRAKLGAVKDYRSAAEFTNFLNVQAENYSKAYTNEIDELNQRRTFARWAYVFLYSLGAVLLLVGLRYDWKGAEE